MNNQYLSIDIGGSSIKYGILDAAGTIIATYNVRKPTELSEFINWFKTTIRHYSDDIHGVGICCPGKVDSNTTMVTNGGAAPYLDGVIFRDLLPSSCRKIPLSIENDAKAATLAEMWLGNLKDVKNGAALILGTSIGGGIVINNELLQGTHLQAGEIGYMLTDPNAKLPKERLAGFNTSAIKMVRQINGITNNPKLDDGIAAFNSINKSKELQLIFRSYCLNIAKIIINMNSVIDVSTIVIGGGVSVQDRLISEINCQYDYLSTEISIISKRLTKPRIIAARFRANANLYGAIYKLLIKMDN